MLRSYTVVNPAGAVFPASARLVAEFLCAAVGNDRAAWAESPAAGVDLLVCNVADEALLLAEARFDVALVLFCPGWFGAGAAVPVVGLPVAYGRVPELFDVYGASGYLIRAGVADLGEAEALASRLGSYVVSGLSGERVFVRSSGGAWCSYTGPALELLPALVAA